MMTISNIIPPYLRDPDEIYDESFRQIAVLSDLSSFPTLLHPVLTRMIHSSGRPEILSKIRYSHGWQDGAFLQKLHSAKYIFTDSEMTRAGIVKSFLPKTIEVICTLNDAATAKTAARLKTTRSAAAIDGWLCADGSAIAVIGNAPTALFRLLENILSGRFSPLLIVGLPVGFVGAAESKACLIAHDRNWHCDWVSLEGREGGSALAAASINGLFAPRPAS